MWNKNVPCRSISLLCPQPMGDIKQFCDPLVCLMPLAETDACQGYDYCRTLIANPMLEVDPLIKQQSPELVEMSGHHIVSLPSGWYFVLWQCMWSCNTFLTDCCKKYCSTFYLAHLATESRHAGCMFCFCFLFIYFAILWWFLSDLLSQNLPDRSLPNCHSW